MARLPPPRSVQRARWLADLAHALDDAHALSVELGRWQADSAEAIALRNRIAAAMAEVEALRRGQPRKAASARDKRPDLHALLGLTPPGAGPRRR